MPMEFTYPRNLHRNLHDVNTWYVENGRPSLHTRSTSDIYLLSQQLTIVTLEIWARQQNCSQPKSVHMWQVDTPVTANDTNTFQSSFMKIGSSLNVIVREHQAFSLVVYGNTKMTTKEWEALGCVTLCCEDSPLTITCRTSKKT